MNRHSVMVASLMAFMISSTSFPSFASPSLSDTGRQFEEWAKQMQGDIRVAYMISLCGYRSDAWFQTFTDNYILAVTNDANLSPSDRRFLLAEGTKSVGGGNLASCSSYGKILETYDRLRYDIENGVAYKGAE